MKQVALEFTYHTDIISVPDGIVGKIKKIQNAFDKWLYDKSNDHRYWILTNGKKSAVSFDSQAFVDYINCVYLESSEEKAILSVANAEKLEDGIPVLYF